MNSRPFSFLALITIALSPLAHAQEQAQPDPNRAYEAVLKFAEENLERTLQAAQIRNPRTVHCVSLPQQPNARLYGGTISVNGSARYAPEFKQGPEGAIFTNTYTVKFKLRWKWEFPPTGQLQAMGNGQSPQVEAIIPGVMLPIWQEPKPGEDKNTTRRARRDLREQIDFAEFRMDFPENSIRQARIKFGNTMPGSSEVIIPELGMVDLRCDR